LTIGERGSNLPFSALEAGFILGEKDFVERIRGLL